VRAEVFAALLFLAFGATDFGDPFAADFGATVAFVPVLRAAFFVTTFFTGLGVCRDFAGVAFDFSATFGDAAFPDFIGALAATLFAVDFFTAGAVVARF
jgi:hypothetical protein